MISRRAALASVASGLGLWSLAEPAQAGRQLEEPLVDSVRTALSSAIANHAPPVLEFTDTEARLQHLRWMGSMSERLRKKKPEWQVRQEFLQTIWYESRRAGLDTAMVLGYMQIMPFWTRVLADGDAGKLFHMQTNLRFGCVILRHYLDREGGDLFLALGRYNGSRGRPPYPNAVFAAQKLWEMP